jgi:small subunit ribosomal protein S20
MANIHSQEKRILRAERERNENRRYTSAIKTYFRRLEAAVAGSDDEQAEAEHRRLVQLIDKAVKRGALHRNTGARKKARAARLRGGPSAWPAAPRHDECRLVLLLGASDDTRPVSGAANSGVSARRR